MDHVQIDLVQYLSKEQAGLAGHGGYRVVCMRLPFAKLTLVLLRPVFHGDH